MGARILFSVKTPLGYQVRLLRDRWRQVVRFKHPALAGREKAVRKCLMAPLVIHTSAKDAETHLYYDEADRGYLCVVAGPTGGDDRFVVTAYFTSKIKQGMEIWKK